jgi:hypothetical protein
MYIRCINNKNPQNYEIYNKHIKEFEYKLSHWYPLGEDEFKIDHGNNYFKFFRRLGEVFYYAVFNSDIIVGTICCVYRVLNNIKMFYMCDLKFDKCVRNKGLMIQILCKIIPICVLKTNKFYAISMNNDQPNKILEMCQHIGNKCGVNVKNSGELCLYSFNYEEMMRFQNIVFLYKSYKCKIDIKNIRYVSLKNIKDLLVKNKNGEVTP